MTMLLIIIIGFAAGIVLVGAIIYVMADYEQHKHGIERDCVHFRRGQCRLTRGYCSPCSLYKTEEDVNARVCSL